MCQPGRPRPIGRVPRRLAGLGRLPQRKVARRVLLVLVHVHARAVFHAAQVFLAQLAVLGKRRQPEVPAPVLGLVSGSGRGQLLHQFHHARNVLGGARQSARAARPRAHPGPQKTPARISAVYSPMGTPAAAALRMILSSTSVMFITWRTGVPVSLQKAAQHVDLQERYGNCRCGRSRRPWARRRTCAAPCRPAGTSGSICPERVLKRRRVMGGASPSKVR